MGRIPPVDAQAPESGPPTHSKYGFFPSLLPLPALAVGWPLRGFLGARGLDACVAATWALGALLAGLAFGKLVRTLRPGATGPWEAAFVSGTFLWSYAADSFVEPFAAAGLAAGAALSLSGRPGRGAALWAAACLLKPVLWITTPVLVLALALDARRMSGPSGVLRALGALAGVGALQGAADLARNGALFSTGYGAEILRFSTPLGQGLYGLVLSPGRSVLLYAPLALVGLIFLRRAPTPAAVLCGGVPLVLLLVVARWWSWEGGASWGPRLLLPVLPLLVAPSVFADLKTIRAAFAVGVCVNVSGTLVTPGAWASYAESLTPPPGARWPAMGLVRAATVPVLTPILGHAWLAVRNLVHASPPAPWTAAGAADSQPPPDPAASVSPWLVRRLAGLPPVSPMLPRLLVRSAAGDLARGRDARALNWAREALRLAPGDPDARRLAAASEGTAPPP